MGHGQVPFSPFFLKATCFPTGPLIKNLVSKYPDGKMGEMEVSGGIRKTGYFPGLVQATPCAGCLKHLFPHRGIVVSGSIADAFGIQPFLPKGSGPIFMQRWAEVGLLVTAEGGPSVLARASAHALYPRI